MLRAARIQFEPLGDAAVLATLASEAAAQQFAAAARQTQHPWLIDVVAAYVTVAVFFDLETTTYDAAVAALRKLKPASRSEPGPLSVIPCCYERQLDLACVAGTLGLSPDEVIHQHCGAEYVVYAVGFCPGFPYLGYLPPGLCGVPRLPQPRVRVEPGSVGLTGQQTGIYPLPRPGGWNLIGQTPLELVHLADGYFPLRAGDRVRFQRIDDAEFERLKGERLPLSEGV